jgi:hypothetical protein
MPLHVFQKIVGALMVLLFCLQGRALDFIEPNAISVYTWQNGSFGQNGSVEIPITLVTAA